MGLGDGGRATVASRAHIGHRVATTNRVNGTEARAPPTQPAEPDAMPALLARYTSQVLKVLGTTLLAVAAVLGGLLAFAPERYEVVREATIAAPAVEVHPWVEDLRRWPEWSLWSSEHDPSLELTYAGPERGVDARESWTSRRGPGSLVITASDPAKGVWYDLVFGQGGGAVHSKGVLQYERVEGGTRVRWTAAGELRGPVARIMGYGMDALMGPQFEAGLAGLKRVVEGTGGGEAAP